MKHQKLTLFTVGAPRIMMLAAVLALVAMPMHPQLTRSLYDGIQTVRLIADDDPLLPPVVRLGGHVEVSFDAMTHEYTRYVYKIVFCNADWSRNDDLFESDWLEGFNSQPIEDYATSLNTSMLYTHYSFAIPNADVRLLLPGNYRVEVWADDGRNEGPVAEACFSLLDPDMSVASRVSSNTDIDFNQSHQQLTWSLNYGSRNVVDPERELHTVVMQNRRHDNLVWDLPPNIRHANGCEWTHRRELIFPAGNEFHKFELLNTRVAGMGVDRMVWEEPVYHVVLFGSERPHTYTYAPDANGAWVVRRSGSDDEDTEAEYVVVHFSLKSPRLAGGDVYVSGQWDNGFPDPRCRMRYDERQGAYEVGVLLKQGYYNYQFLQTDADGRGHSDRTDGNFYETENEYVVLVYHRPPGERYDALVAYQRILSGK